MNDSAQARQAARLTLSIDTHVRGARGVRRVAARLERQTALSVRNG